METVEIKSFSGQGYKALVSYGAWRAAVLRYLDEMQPNNIHRMERHTLTDEVFILTAGRASLLIGGNQPNLSEIEIISMKTGDFYNVKQNTWHAVLMSPDANIIIVENDDTSLENTEFHLLSNNHLQSLHRLAQEFYRNEKSI